MVVICLVYGRYNAPPKKMLDAKPDGAKTPISYMDNVVKAKGLSNWRTVTQTERPRDVELIGFNFPD